MASFANLSSKLDIGHAFVEWHMNGFPGATIAAQNFLVSNPAGYLTPNSTEDAFLGEETPFSAAIPRGGFPDWIAVDEPSDKITLQPGDYKFTCEFYGRVGGVAATGVGVNWAITDGSTAFLTFQQPGGTIQLYLDDQNVHQTREGCFTLTDETDLFVYCIEVGTSATETVACQYFRTSIEKL